MKLSKDPVNRKIQALSKALEARAVPSNEKEARRKSIIAQARAMYESVDLEIDSDAAICETGCDAAICEPGGGVWVQAWVWVAEEENEEA